jgi:hypothetical protein
MRSGLPKSAFLMGVLSVRGVSGSVRGGKGASGKGKA